MTTRRDQHRRPLDRTSIILALIAGTPALIAAIASCFVSIYGVTKQTTMAKDIRSLEINTNSIKDALVARTREAALAEGNMQGRAAEAAANAESSQLAEEARQNAERLNALLGAKIGSKGKTPKGKGKARTVPPRPTATATAPPLPTPTAHHWWQFGELELGHFVPGPWAAL